MGFSGRVRRSKGSHTRACRNVQNAFWNPVSYPSGTVTFFFISALRNSSVAAAVPCVAINACARLMPIEGTFGKKSHPLSTHSSRNFTRLHPVKSNGAPLAGRFAVFLVFVVVLGVTFSVTTGRFTTRLDADVAMPMSSSSSSSSPGSGAASASFFSSASSSSPMSAPFPAASDDTSSETLPEGPADAKSTVSLPGGPLNTSATFSSIALPCLSSLNRTVGHPYATKSLSSVKTTSTPLLSPPPSCANAAICASASYGATMNSKPSRSSAAMSSCAIAGVTSIPCWKKNAAPSLSPSFSFAWPFAIFSPRRSLRSFSSPPFAGSRSPSNTITGVKPKCRNICARCTQYFTYGGSRPSLRQ
mmetsp:Transcript_605/g.2338  ORF Transcript_605/g.2338 Transcript_605/m.2338 type:complete len:360 (+) Transcript_605:6156-7235(+)